MTPDSKDVPWARDMDRIFGALNVVDNWDLSNWQTVSASGGTLGAGLGAPRSAWAPALGVTPSPVPFDFSISTTPSSGFVPVHGGSVNTAMTTQRTFGPSHSVRYSCSGLPSGTTCTFTPPSGNPTSTATLVLATSSSTPAGTYTVNIQATDGTITRTSGFTVTVGDPLLAYDMETLTADGKMLDLSGHGHSGTITGTTDVPGVVGRARDSGSGDSRDRIETDTGTTDEYTLAIWGKVPFPTGGDGWKTAFRWGDGYHHLLISPAGEFGSYNQGFKSSGFNVNSLPAGWYHFAVRAQPGGTSADFFVDGISVASNIAGAKMPFAKSAVRGVLNTYQGLWPQAWGPGDEAYVFSRALSDTEIAALAGRSGDGLVLRYDMGTLTADGKMKDLSGNGHDGTITGTTDVPGVFGRARDSGSGDSRDRIETDTGLLDAYTLAIWGKVPFPTGVDGWKTAFRWGDHYHHLLIRSDGELGAYNNGFKDSGFNVNSLLSGWHHFVVRAYAGGTTADFFVDGTLVASNVADAKMPLANSAVRSVLNTYQGLWPQAWGPGDEAYVFNRALSETEIVALYHG